MAALDPAATPPAHPGRAQAPAAARESGAAAAAGVRGPALDRYRDPGVAGQPGREPADRPPPPAGQLPPGVPARLGQQDLLHPAPAGPAAPGERRGTAPGPAGRRPQPGTAQAAADRAHRGQPLLPGGERAHPGGDRGAGRRAGGLSPGASRSPTIQVPATVQAVLAARIDRLPPEEKRLLQTAAVIGTEVPLPLLQAIAELPEEALHRGLAHLQAAEFLYETQPVPRARLHLQARPDPRGGLRQPAPGAAAGAARPHRRGPRGAAPETGWPSRSNAWPTMPCGARCGTRP